MTTESICDIAASKHGERRFVHVLRSSSDGDFNTGTTILTIWRMTTNRFFDFALGTIGGSSKTALLQRFPVCEWFHRLCNYNDEATVKQIDTIKCTVV